MALEEAKNPVKGVSGPGKYAKRTDRIPANSYGDQTELADIASGAPIARAPKTVKLSEAPAVPTQEPITSLYAPSQRPDEPITHGIPLGAGGGPEVLNTPNQESTQYQSAYDLIQQLAKNPEASPTLLYLAQRIQQGF